MRQRGEQQVIRSERRKKIRAVADRKETEDEEEEKVVHQANDTLQQFTNFIQYRY